MSGMAYLQKARFYFKLRNEERHPELVELLKKSAKAELERARKSGLMQKLFILITDDGEDPSYADAFKMYSDCCNGMSKADLLEYAEYLHKNFGFEIPKKYFEFKPNSSQPQKPYQKHPHQTQRG